MNSSLFQGLVFLVSTLFDMFLLLLVVRVMLAYTGVNYYDPITQFVVKLTDWLIKPLRRVIPTIKHIEIASLLAIFILELIKFYSVSVINFGPPNLLGIGLLAISDMLKLFIQFFFYAILVQVIISWLQPGSPIMYTIYRLTAPVMRPIQRIIPPIAGIDISPIPAMIGLQFLLIVLVSPITSFAVRVALS